MKLFNLKEKCLWSIKNFNKLNPEDRINIKNLIYELTEQKKTMSKYKLVDFKSQIGKDIPIHLLPLRSTFYNTGRRNSKIVRDPTSKIKDLLI